MLKYCIVAFFIVSIKCWSQLGHLLTSAIAQIVLKQKSPDTFVQFSNLVISINKFVSNQSQTMIESACWPDDIKSYDSFWNNWHFTDIPYINEGVIPVINYTQSLMGSLNIVENAKIVLSKNLDKNTAERALMGRYLIHLVGDIHQPLHSVALFTSQFITGDQGGNKITIKIPNGTNVNFHTFWDQGGYKFQNNTYKIVRPLNQNNYTSLMSRASQIIAQYGNQVEPLSHIFDSTVWAFQSFQYGMNTTYPSVLKSKTVDATYVDLTYQTSKKRVALAGYRLANLVYEIYNNKQEKFKEEIKVRQNLGWLFQLINKFINKTKHN